MALIIVEHGVVIPVKTILFIVREPVMIKVVQEVIVSAILMCRSQKCRAAIFVGRGVATIVKAMMFIIREPVVIDAVCVLDLEISVSVFSEDFT